VPLQQTAAAVPTKSLGFATAGLEVSATAMVYDVGGKVRRFPLLEVNSFQPNCLVNAGHSERMVL
jgi:hypothetical protein